MTFTLTGEQAARARVLLAELTTLFAEPAPAPTPAEPTRDMITPPVLAPADYVEASKMLGCDVATVMAVRDVESNGHGFAPDGRPIILFEPHVFSKLTQHRFDSTHGGVSYPKWGTKPYPKTQAERWDQLRYALQLPGAGDAAYQAASWGLFQIMGFNFAACGFSSVSTFAQAMYTSEREHLMAFVKFVQNNHLHIFLRDHRWAAFAAGYNGPSYQKNAYDQKLAAAYARHGGT